MKVLTRRGVLPALVFLGSLGLYAATAIRTPGWLDDTLILSLARSAALGSWVNTHNLFNLLGWCWISLFSFLDPHAALTLLCGLFASTAVLFAYHAGRELTGNPLAAALAAAALAVSHSLWWHATVVEVYSLNAALISLDLFLVLRYFRARSFPCLMAGFFLLGVGVFNHVLMGLFLPASAVLFVMLLARPRRIGWRRALLLAGAALIGCVPYLVIFAREVASDMPARGFGAAFLSVLDGATGSFFRQSMFPTNLAPGQKLFWRLNYVFLLWYNYPAAALPLAVWGALRMRLPDTPRPFALFFFLALAAQLIWSSNYLIWDMYAFAMPVYVLASLPLAAGIDALLRRARTLLRPVALASLFLPLALYPAVTGIPFLADLGRRYVALYVPAPSGLQREYAAASGLEQGKAAAPPNVWDTTRYLMNPVRSGYREVAEFCEGVLDRLPAGARYWDDDSNGGYPLYYYYRGMLGRRPDLSLHLVLGMHVDETAARQAAVTMREELASQKELFVSQLAWPERELVIQLSLLMSPGTDASRLRRLDVRTFRRDLPALEVQEIPLGSGQGPAVYRIRPR
jgi:hypothetical protein